MSVFASQFDRARPYSAAYTGAVDDSGWRTPLAAAALVAGVGLAVVAAVEAASWGDGWDSGWDAPSPEVPSGDDSAWSHHGDYTDAHVGGDDGFFYFIDGDSS